jgi:hypothetical protein
MLVTAVAFSDVILAVHIAAVVISFGVTFAYPVMLIASERMDRRTVPWFHRLQQAIGRRLTNPGLTIVLLAGIYLASHEHQWKSFFVQWGLGAVVVLGGLEGGFMIPTAGKLADLAERDLAAAAAGSVQWSPEYLKLRRRVGLVGALMSVLVLLTIYLMTVHAGA